MHKFKIGDKVKVVDEKAMVAHRVHRDAIREGTVKDVYEDGCVKLQEDCEGWWYPENCLDFAEQPSPDLSASETQPETQPELTQKTYTVREVLDAYREYSGYDGRHSAPSDVVVNATQKILDRRADSDYATYLELKKRFEN